MTIIRLAEPADVLAIMRIIGKVVPVMQVSGNFQWDDNYPNPVVFENDIAKNQLWVAVVDDVIAGVAALTTDQDAEYAQVGWDITEPAIVTHHLAVDPDHGGKGIAAALLMQAEHVAIDKNIDILRIDTNSKNQATQKLFPKLGYVFAGEIDLDFRPNLRFYCYEKRLS